ncbi:hypothetical protein BC829DRAFT_417720 [Chytridium lagenaria]|nr:hypothetical protein BC829DRAFT_417720 [Chytridium lagenaria]
MSSSQATDSGQGNPNTIPVPGFTDVSITQLANTIAAMSDEVDIFALGSMAVYTYRSVDGGENRKQVKKTRKAFLPSNERRLTTAFNKIWEHSSSTDAAVIPFGNLTIEVFRNWTPSDTRSRRTRVRKIVEVERSEGENEEESGNRRSKRLKEKGRIQADTSLPKVDEEIVPKTKGYTLNGVHFKDSWGSMMDDILHTMQLMRGINSDMAVAALKSVSRWGLERQMKEYREHSLGIFVSMCNILREKEKEVTAWGLPEISSQGRERLSSIWTLGER